MLKSQPRAKEVILFSGSQKNLNQKSFLSPLCETYKWILSIFLEHKVANIQLKKNNVSQIRFSLKEG